MAGWPRYPNTSLGCPQMASWPEQLFTGILTFPCSAILILFTKFMYMHVSVVIVLSIQDLALVKL